MPYTYQQSSENNPPIPKTSVKRGKDTVKLTSEDLSDRIINLRFVHKPLAPGMTPKMFTLRSDYEPMYRDGGFQYIVCRQKPAIKVEYKQVADDTVIDLNIDVTNLFIKDPSVFEVDGGPIQQVEIQMGYRSQMVDWTQQPYDSHGINEFNALAESSTAANRESAVLPTKLVAQVLSVQRISSPPDMITRFQCVVGTMENGLRWVFDEESLERDLAAQSSAHWGENSPVNWLPDTFFSLVTRRFVRGTVRHDIHTVENEKTDEQRNVVLVVDQSVTVYDEAYENPKQLTLVGGRMSADDADNYGVIVYMSQTLWNTPVEELPLIGLTPDEAAQAVPIDQSILGELQNKVSAQMKAIVKQYPFIRFYALSDGNFYAYHVNEKKEKFFEDRFIIGEQEKKLIALPAVYDISWGGTRQIRCPFFSVIGSMRTVAFQAKYALNDIVGNFYSPKKENNCFLVLLADIVFSTVGKENMMTLTCVDIEGQYKPATAADGMLQTAKAPDVVQPETRDKVWKYQNLEVVYVFKGNPGTTDSSWSSIVNMMLSSAMSQAKRWKEAGEEPTAAKVLDMLQAMPENAALFGPSRLAQAVSTESTLLGRPLPVLYGKEHNPVNPGHGDIVKVKLPFLPQYREDKRIT